MAAPTQKPVGDDESESDPSASKANSKLIRGGDQGSQVPDAVLRLVEQSRRAKEGGGEPGAESQAGGYQPMAGVNQPPSPDKPGDYKPGGNLGIPENWQAPQSDRSGLQKQAYDAGKGIGDLKSGLDRKHDEGIAQARQAAAGGAGEAAKGLAGEAAGAKGSADPTKATLQKVTTAAGAPDKMATLLVAVICLFALVVSIGIINIPFSILLLVCLLVSPKYTYKGTLAILSLIFGPEVYEFGTDIDPNQIKLKAWHKIVIVFEILLLAGIMMAVFIIVSYQACRVVTLGNSTAGYYASGAAISIADLALGTGFEGVHDTCSKFMTSFDNIVGGAGSSPTTLAGKGSIAKWMPLIAQASSQNNIDQCVLVAILQHESSSDPNAIGHDHTAPSGGTIRRWQSAQDGPKAQEPNKAHDPFQNSPPQFGLDWHFSHGIGLMQVTIFPYTGSNWINSGTPSINYANKWYTVADLLDPATTLDAGARLFALKLKAAGGDYLGGFTNYGGGGAIAAQHGAEFMKYFNTCKAGQNL